MLLLSAHPQVKIPHLAKGERVHAGQTLQIVSIFGVAFAAALGDEAFHGNGRRLGGGFVIVVVGGDWRVDGDFGVAGSRLVVLVVVVVVALRHDIVGLEMASQR